MKIQVSTLVGAGVGGVIVASPFGALPLEVRSSSARFGSCRSASTSSARRVRGPGAGVEVGAAAPGFVFVSLVSTLVAWVAGSSAWQGRGLGTGVCVAEAWMPERRLWERFPCC
jgi:hypothetical protein